MANITLPDGNCSKCRYFEFEKSDGSCERCPDY